MLTLELINYGSRSSETISIESVASKPIERIAFTKYKSNQQVDLAYYEAKEVTVDRNLFILERHHELAENNFLLFEDFELQNIKKTKVFSLPYKEVLITDRVYKDKEGLERPLFFKHKIKRKAVEIHMYSVENGKETEINSGFEIDESNGEIYTNYFNSYNYDNGGYKLYFVSYTDENGVSYNELLNPIRAIQEANYEAIDPITGKIIKDVFTVDRQGSSFRFEIFLSESVSSRFCKTGTDRFYIKPLRRNEISLIKPETIYNDNPWYVRVGNGDFFSRGKRYHIAEFATQSFTNQYGLIRLEEKDSYYVTNNVIKLPVNNVKFDRDSEIHLDVIIYDEEETPLKVLTSDTRKAGKRYLDTDVIYETDGIVSVDEEYGFVEINKSIDISNTIKASFYNNTRELVYNKVDLNPSNNKKLIDHRYVFYLVPGLAEGEVSVHHLLLDEQDIIIDCSEERFKLLFQGIYNANTLIKKTLTEFETNHSVLTDNEDQYLILGEVSILDNSRIEDSFVFDLESRLQVDETKIDESVLRNYNLLQSKYMYGEDGQTVQRNNVVYLEAPIDLLIEHGGQYREEEVEELFNYRLPYDVQKVITFVYPKTKLDVELLEDFNKINFTWEGPYTYKLYRAKKNKSAERELVEEKTVLESENHYFTDENVNENTVYFYWIGIENYPLSNPYGVRTR